MDTGASLLLLLVAWNTTVDKDNNVFLSLFFYIPISIYLYPNECFLQVASIIFLDAPVGTGFSYSTTQQGWSLNDYESADYIYKFLRKV